MGHPGALLQVGSPPAPWVTCSRVKPSGGRVRPRGPQCGVMCQEGRVAQSDVLERSVPPTKERGSGARRGSPSDPVPWGASWRAHTGSARRSLPPRGQDGGLTSLVSGETKKERKETIMSPFPLQGMQNLITCHPPHCKILPPTMSAIPGHAAISYFPTALEVKLASNAQLLGNGI